MKTLSITYILLVALYLPAIAFDTEKASTERFKVAYVEPKELPSLEKLPSYYPGREVALRNEKEHIQLGTSPEALNQFRRMHFRDALFPIRVTDTVTGNIYEVQEDRRTIIATKADGTRIWKVNPFKDAGLEPYRSPHPIIAYFGKASSGYPTGKRDQYLGVGFNSSQFGAIDLKSGTFTGSGQD